MRLKSVFLYVLCNIIVTTVRTDTFSVKVATDRHVNVVDSKFLSFTVDPKYLFSSNEKYNKKECICMASSLTPAYIRIAGPSTSHMTFYNTTISIQDQEPVEERPTKFKFQLNLPKELKAKKTKREHKAPMVETLEVSHYQWKKFIAWAKSTGFELVFALNNEERTGSGMWDPNRALNILTEAEKSKIGNIFWELGYECRNQSIEEYLNDLETLRVIVETFESGKEEKWKVVGGDITNCLHVDSKSDFKDYVILSDEMMDAVLLNGNSSSHELERLSEQNRLKLLKLLSRSTTPLWLTEITQKDNNEVERAADWLSSLGFSARNGFSVHYRELLEEEMYEPTMSFYMALLFKNLVGERVLNIEMDSEQAILFAHCTSLRHKAVPGAVTLYGANMDDEPARFSLKLSKIEEGGDIMQFVLAHDHSGNIVVNGRAMFYEGDIKPVVKRVRPYKTLLINLPPKSFGFWVLANTNVEACQDYGESNENKTFVEAVTINTDTNNTQEDTAMKTKRSASGSKDIEDLLKADISVDFDHEVADVENDAFKSRINNLNSEVNKVHNVFKDKLLKKESRYRRHIQVSDEYNGNKDSYNRKEHRKQGIKIRNDRNRAINTERKPKTIIGTLLKFTRRNFTRNLKNDRSKKGLHVFRNKVNKRNSKYSTAKTKDEIDVMTMNSQENHVRTRRSLLYNDVKTHIEREDNETSQENEVDIDGKENIKIWKLLRNINKELRDLSLENYDYDEKSEDQDTTKDYKESEEEIETKHNKDKASIELSDESSSGFMKSTVENLLKVLVELNKNLNKFWNSISLLD